MSSNERWPATIAKGNVEGCPGVGVGVSVIFFFCFPEIKYFEFGGAPGKGENEDNPRRASIGSGSAERNRSA